MNTNRLILASFFLSCSLGAIFSQPGTVAKREAGKSLVADSAALPTGSGVFIGDPIQVGVGNYILEETDLSYTCEGVPVSFGRKYSSNEKRVGSLGLGWWFSYDTRVIRGIDEEMETSYAERSSALETLIRETEQKNRLMFEENDKALAANEILLQKNKAEKESAEAEGKSTVESEKKIAQMNRTLALNIQTREVLDTLKAKIETMKTNLQIWGRRKELSAVNRELNRYVLGDTDPGYLSQPDPKMVIMLSETGEVNGYTIDAEPDYASTATLANGMINYYPEGSLLSAYTRNADTMQLLNDGRMLRTDKRGVRSVYDIYGRISLMLDNFGNRVGFFYGEDGKLAATQDEYGRICRISRLDGRIVGITDPVGRTVRYGYNADGLLSKITDPTGTVIQYEYDGTLMVKIVKSDGSYRECFYDVIDGKTVTVRTTDEEGHSEKFAYDFTKGMTEFVNKSGIIQKFYTDDDLNIIKTEYADGKPVMKSGNTVSRDVEAKPVVSYSQDEKQNWIATLVYADGSRETVAYDDHGRMVSRTDKKGVIASFTLDAYGYPAKVDYSDGSREQYVFDPVGCMLKFEDKNGIVTDCLYDADDNLVERKVGANATERFVYNNRKDLVASTVGTDSTTRYFYDKRHLLLCTVAPDGAAVGTEYRPDAQPALNRTGTARLKPGAAGSALSDWDFSWTEVKVVVYDAYGNTAN